MRNSWPSEFVLPPPSGPPSPSSNAAHVARTTEYVEQLVVKTNASAANAAAAADKTPQYITHDEGTKRKREGGWGRKKGLSRFSSQPTSRASCLLILRSCSSSQARLPSPHPVRPSPSHDVAPTIHPALTKVKRALKRPKSRRKERAKSRSSLVRGHRNCRWKNAYFILHPVVRSSSREGGEEEV